MARKKPLVDQLLEDVAVGRKKPGRHRVEPNLYVQVKPRKKGGYSASWLSRFERGGRNRWRGLGPYPLLSIKDAQTEVFVQAQAWNAARGDGQLHHVFERALRQEARTRTLEQCAVEYIEGHMASWRNKNYANQWPASLRTYIPPSIARKPVNEIGAEDVLEILKPVWTRIPPTAMRLRERLEAILGYAAAKKYRSADNPARWRGHLENLLSAPRKLHTVRHHPALPYREVPQLMAELLAEWRNAAQFATQFDAKYVPLHAELYAGSVAPTRAEKRQMSHGFVTMALTFAILTACRTNEVRGADWLEIDRANKIWTIPAARMKSGREHRVPLTDAALALLPDRVPLFLVKRDAMQDRLQRMRPGYHVHGLRASFSTWASEETDFAYDVIETCLAHAVGTAVGQAYKRGELFEKRRRLMAAWCAFCLTAPAENVVPLRAAK